ncbi:MAG: hypothetical protein V4463_01085 [Pseudomonadota bacterium]
MKKLLAAILLLPTFLHAQVIDPGVSRAIDTDVWNVISSTVAIGDAAAMARAYHPDAVLVSAFRKKSVAIAEIMKVWADGMAKDKAEGGRATVAFRFAARTDNAATAFETGIFKYTSVDRTGVAKVSYSPFEMLLVKKDGAWRILMERQLAETDAAAWDKLAP